MAPAGAPISTGSSLDTGGRLFFRTFEPLADARSVDSTFIVQKVRHVEFVIEPPQ